MFAVEMRDYATNRRTHNQQEEKQEESPHTPDISSKLKIGGKMKFYSIIIMIVIIVSLSAQISDPIEINGEYPYKMSSNQRVYQIVDGTVFLTYRYQDHYIYFNRISATNYQTHTSIDTLNNWYDCFNDPTIQGFEQC